MFKTLVIAFDISISGSGDIDTKINKDKIKANVSGSVTIFLQGDAFESSFVVSVCGKIKVYDLVRSHCQASISGSGNVYVNANQTIDTSISGSGSVYYVNHPSIHTSVSGSGGVVDKNQEVQC